MLIWHYKINSERIFQMTKIVSVITLILFIITVGCGLAIHYGGEPFKNAVKGHMILGVLTLISFAVLFISIFK